MDIEEQFGESTLAGARFGSGKKSLAAQFNISPPLAKRPQPENNVKNWRDFLKSAVSNLKVHNTFKNMRKYIKRGKPNSCMSPDIVPFNSNYDEIYRLIESSFEANIKNYILLTGSSGNGRTSAVYYAMNKMMENDNLKALKEKDERQKEERQKEKEPLGDRTNSLKYSSNASDGNVSKHNYYKTEGAQDGGMGNALERQATPYMPLVFVEVDAFIYNQETKVNNYIINELTNRCADNEVDSGALAEMQEGEANSYAKLSKYTNIFRIVLYIKNIDVFAEEARQVYLYSLLDGSSFLSMKATIIVSTSCLFFMNKLEKRVKSRFSFKNFIFEDYEVVTDLVPVLQKRLEYRSTNLHTRDLAAKVQDVLKDERLQQILHRYHTIGMSISWFVSLFKNTFLLMHPAEVDAEHKKGQLADYIIEKVKQAKKLLLFEGGDADILMTMPRPSKLIILVLHEVYNLRNQELGVTYDKFRRKVKDIVNDKFSSYTARTTWGGFTECVMKDNLLTLKKMNYIHLDRTPVTLETVIQLNDSVSPTFLNVRVTDSDIAFD